MAVVFSKSKSGFHANRAEVFIYKSRKYADQRHKKISKSTYLRFPVPPSVGISENTANPFTMEEVLGKGQVTVFSGDELKTLEMGELLWPRVYDDSFCTSKPAQTPDEAASIIKKWKDQRSPVRVIIGEHAQLAMDCTIQDLTIEFERPGHVGDAWISFKLVEYKAPTIRRTKVSVKRKTTKKPVKKGKSSKPRSKAPKKTTPPVYTVRRNDVLGAIAKRYYGSADYKYYNAIYNANKAEFAKYHRKYKPRSRFTIYPGMKLKIPKKP